VQLAPQLLGGFFGVILWSGILLWLNQWQVSMEIFTTRWRQTSRAFPEIRLTCGMEIYLGWLGCKLVTGSPS
jgi:hypothetical protein